VDAYERTLDWLYSLEKAKGIELKLERVRAALAALGDPQASLRCFHVAGTNGKGSVVAFLASILGAAGHRVGVYTSPHLVELTERIRVGDTEIGRDEVVALAGEVRERVLDRGVDLTFFEILTAMAFVHFARAGVDWVALEVGLGGRLDATNVVDPVVSVITSIGIDHVNFLGAAVRDIAVEKAGIVKPHRPLVVGPIGEEALAVIERIASENAAPLYRRGREYDWRPATGDAMSFDGLGWHLDELEIGLVGRHQRDNAATAIAAVAAVRDRVAVGEAALRRGLASARWPGRLETVLDEPLTIVDGAHNVEAMRAVVPEIVRIAGGRPLHVLFAAMGDKDWRAMIEILGPHCTSAVVTEVLAERAAPGDQLRAAFAAHCPATFEPDAATAFARLRSTAGRGDVAVVTGSLFLVGAVHGFLRGRRQTAVVL
jgi:dihydrofolate synthase / folylpolyglutamate synthase